MEFELKADRETLIAEQQADESLAICWSLAKQGKGNFIVENGILYRDAKILGQNFRQLCLPEQRRRRVLELAHDRFGGHLATKKTTKRIALSFYWPKMKETVQKYISECVPCQKRAPITFRDRVPITPVPRADRTFSHWVIDCAGPFSSHHMEYPYALLMVDSASRWPAAYPLRSWTAKSVCQALMKQFMITGVPVSIWSDNPSNFTGKLTREFLLKLGCQPRFSTPSHPQAAGLCERWVGTLKSMVSKVAQDHPRQWHQYLDYIVWALRETPNQTTGIQPCVLAFGYLPRGPLSILKESWTGERELPLDLGKSPTEYLAELRNNLETANAYADSYTARAQQRYATHYNLRSRDKHFTVGEKVLILTSDSSASKVFSRWKGPATIAEVRSPYSYITHSHGSSKVL